MFEKVLIANRGAIACRIIRTLRRMRVGSVAVFSEPDRGSLHVGLADEAIALGGSTAAESYLQPSRLIAAALSAGARAIHPGYGFLSENADFAEQCAAAGIAFIGPTTAQMRAFGLKHTARALARESGLPLLPGSGLLTSLDHALEEAERVGYPVMLKSTAGGGGIGMQLCAGPAALKAAYESVARLAANNFRDPGLFLERYIENARHIEVQIFGDGAGKVVALGERDCSVQRRNQKVIEETPAPGIPDELRAKLLEAARTLGRAVSYRSAGTVEFVYDADRREFYFLEVNTRLQVEHGVTEEVTGVDLVEWMVRLAAGEPCNGDVQVQPQGHAIQARLYAEDPARKFRPSSGVLSHVSWPEDARVDTWVEAGSEVSAFYDPMLAKIIVSAPTRALALEKLANALAKTRVSGIETNIDYLRAIVRDEAFVAGRQTTRMLESFAFSSASIEVLSPGTHSTVQDFPGRIGYWNVGVPPSGPMDELAFRLANRILGNPESAAGLELTGSGPTLKFSVPAVIALTGARMNATLDGAPLDYWIPVRVSAGSVLRIGAIEGAGQRTYLAVKGGLKVPPYMGSRSTFTLGRFGGHAGRALRAADVLHLAGPDDDLNGCAAIPQSLIPRYTNEWRIAVTYGPHGAPDFFTVKDMEALFSAAWQVHYNSSRTGVRLIGPRPEWARADGGEAGLHPSNIHDNAYAVGAIDYTGDMPVILGPDGPSLGGFVCPATVARADLWKLGQLRPGDTVRFERLSCEEAVARWRAQDEAISRLEVPRRTPTQPPPPLANATPILARTAKTASTPEVCYRHSGEDYLLIEFGPPVLDLALRFRVHALMQWLEARAVPGIIELTPGIRSLQVHYDCRKLPRERLLRLLEDAQHGLAASGDVEVSSRIVYLPLSWDDPATRLAIQKYMQSVRADAPWCPSNIEFIRRINGLQTCEDVKRIVFEARYLVLGLGDVYLGAPVATPLDPRHRLVTTKYNPARTWTPENAVGIGGAYLCIYGMEGPGGYQFVGRTVQMWNRYRATVDFPEGKPWLLRFFDQIRFYPVSAEELLVLREAFEHGRWRLRVEHTTLRLGEYEDFLKRNADSIRRFKAQQQAAFDAERDRWRASASNWGESQVETGALSDGAPEPGVPQGCIAVSAPVTGNVWQVTAAQGRVVRAGEELVVIEAMKMEIPIVAEADGEVIEVRCARGRTVSAGETVIVMRSL